MLSNCIIYAWRKWRSEGGYILFRRSRHGWYPHALHMTDEGKITSYVPLDANRYHCRRLFPPPLFRGHIKTGDDD